MNTDWAAGVADAAKRPDLDEQFWDARPAHGLIREFALSRMASPWAVFGVIILDVLHYVPPWVTTPANIIGGRGSFNTILGLVSGTGLGKGTAIQAAKDAVELSHIPIRSAAIGTGEGFLDQYAHNERDKSTGRWETKIDHHEVLFTVNEIDTLAALWGRQGATLRSTLREAYMGEQLGFGYRDPTKRIILPPHSYRFGLVIGIQPERAEPLLNNQDAHGGTPGRLVWLPATDPSITADDREAQSLKIQATRGSWPTEPIKVPEPIRRELREHFAERQQGAGDPFVSHRMFTQLKITLPIALLADRREISMEDWELASYVMAKSDVTLQSTLSTMTRAKSRGNREQGYAAGERELAKKNVIDRDAIQRVSRALLRVLDKVDSDGWISRRDLKHRLSGDDKRYFEDAITALIDSGQVEDRPIQTDHGGHRGTEYRRHH